MKNGQSQVICDVASPFPCLTSFLVDPVENMSEIESFFQNLISMTSEDELETETILGPVVEAALKSCLVDNSNWLTEGLDAAQIKQMMSAERKSIPVGKVYLFHCSLPTYGVDGQTPGRLRPRWTTSPDDMRRHLGTDKEKTVLAPESSKYYNNLGQTCLTDFGSGVELFLFPPVNGAYLDVASISELTRLTGTGAIYKYYNDYSDKFVDDLKYSLKSSSAFDAIMKVRTSAGIRATDYHGYYFQRTSSDIELATVNAGWTLGVELKYDDKLPEDDHVVVQVSAVCVCLCFLHFHRLINFSCRSLSYTLR